VDVAPRSVDRPEVPQVSPARVVRLEHSGEDLATGIQKAERRRVELIH
jgi:hypothetical protein